ncbi:hypothetical protein [Halalkalibacter krulwichiae]|uniref:Uncharacterized protein n=1 Tax=Halalkalibacter krulwichiae TaxID=199441 RepID=A0A1X9MGH0_9BACI|nr:hypothetical protein [Halalkalibacter krulwichiae]ARK32547.1 hypothetical protein BkAM31D_23235 [Halalkalibacter krulwichiae]
MPIIYILWDLKLFLLIILGVLVTGTYLLRLKASYFLFFFIPASLIGFTFSIMLLIDYEYHFVAHTDLSELTANDLSIGLKKTDSK